MRKIILLLFLLPACSLLNQQKTTESYDVSSKPLGEGEHEIVMHGKSGVPKDELKRAFKVHGSEICTGKVYLLRGMREEYDTRNDSYMLKGQADCVELSYFAGQ
ncbi:MAG: hypothetical protein ACN2B6_06245 [Rickettsiales bacterium]